MSDQENDAPLSWDVDDFDLADTAEMVVLAPNGRLTTWTWIFAGPAHEKTIAQGNRLSREALHEANQKEAARVNGRKWKPAEDSPDEVRKRNVEFIVERLLGWRGGTRGGVDFPFSIENAREVLMDRRKAPILLQALEFLGETSSFTKRSAET